MQSTQYLDIDIKSALSALFMKWPYALLLLTTSLLLSVVYLHVANKSYQASVVAVPAQGDEKIGLGAIAGQLLGGAASSLGISPGSSSDTLVAIEVLTSEQFLLSWAEKNDLKKELFAYLYDSDGKQWGDGGFTQRVKRSIKNFLGFAVTPRRKLNDENEPLDSSLYERLNESVLEVSVDPKSSKLSVTVTTGSPSLSARLANDILSTLNQTMRERSKMQSAEALEFLNTAMASAEVADTRKTIAILMEAQLKTLMLADSREDFSFTIVSPAIAPEKPTAPNPVLVLVAACLISCSLYFAFVLLVFRKSIFVGVSRHA